MTEDYALGMELKKEKYHCRYVREYLALGAASPTKTNWLAKFYDTQTIFPGQLQYPSPPSPYQFRRLPPHLCKNDLF